MTITLSCLLAVPAKTAFEQVKRPALLHYVAQPFLYFKPRSAFPPVWKEGTYETQLLLFGRVPLGMQLIRIEIPVETTLGLYRLRDNGQGRVAHTWDHWITITALDSRHCRYTDTVKVQAGWLTPVVWLFAYGFYRWRQYRWQQLVKTNFQPIH